MWNAFSDSTLLKSQTESSLQKITERQSELVAYLALQCVFRFKLGPGQQVSLVQLGLRGEIKLESEIKPKEAQVKLQISNEFD